jgi:hypothetical protein
MANIKYFADLADRVVTFDRVDHRRDGAFGYDLDTKTWIKTTRKVEYKSFASRHECDDRCVNATGRVMKCECSCGGKNHGRGVCSN